MPINILVDCLAWTQRMDGLALQLRMTSVLGASPKFIASKRGPLYENSTVNQHWHLVFSDKQRNIEAKWEPSMICHPQSFYSFPHTRPARIFLLGDKRQWESDA